MTCKSLIAILSLLLLGACSSGWSTTIELGPKGRFAYSGPAGSMAVANDGPGTIDISAEQDGGSILFETPLDEDGNCYLKLAEGDRFRIDNRSDLNAVIRLEFEDD